MIYETLMEQLNDPSPEVRETVCWTLGQLHYKDATKRLAKLLKGDPSEFVRLAAASALAQIRDRSSTAALTSALEDPDMVVRLGVISGLGKMRDPRAVDALKKALEKDENGQMRDLILQVLFQITGVTHRYLTSEERKIEKYKLEVQLRPESGHAHYNLAVAYFHHRQYILARDQCETARKLGTGVGWLKRRLEELPADAFNPAVPPPEPSEAVREYERDAGLEGDLVYDSGEVPSEDEPETDEE
jgi:hypothetical protein